MATTKKAGVHAPAVLPLDICLENKSVHSSQGEGHIQDAVRRTNIRDLPNTMLAYAVRVRPYWQGLPSEIKPDFWTTIYISLED